MSNSAAAHLALDRARSCQALVVGRAGLDLYPEPDGCKIRDAANFSSDLGGSAGNIAVAIARAGARVGLISALSRDAVGAFVRRHLEHAGVDLSLVGETSGNERTSLALAEVRQQDCEVVIYRNDPADLQVRCTVEIEQALSASGNLVITGTSLNDAQARREVLAMMRVANRAGCQVWLDLDYRAWNWPSPQTTREVYREAAALAQVLVGNEDEFAVLDDDIEAQARQCRQSGQVMILKRGAGGAILYAGAAQLCSGIYPLQALKPYGAGDAFLGNLLVSYVDDGNWLTAASAASAAAALVVSRRGCAAAMPTPDQLTTLRRQHAMSPAATWR